MKTRSPSIRDRVLRKRGLDGDNSYLKFIIFFPYRTSYQYDYMGRLVAFTQIVNGGRRPADKTVTQFFYADVRHPTRVTHVQSPKSGLTQRLLYDDLGQLICVETKDQKLYVAADHMGSPVLIFRPDGTVDKVIKYTAYGHIVSDSSPAMKLPLGYRGGMIIGKFVFF